MKRWGLFLFSGWITVTIALFLATVAGRVSELQFSVTGNGIQMIQAIVMSIIVIPIIIYLYKKMHEQMNKPEKPAYSLDRAPHSLTGFLFVLVLAVSGLFLMDAIGWITLEQWHSPKAWVGALLLNMSIALFYEALPEEIAMRGFIYDMLRLKLSVWQTVIIQAFIFLAFSAGVTLLQVMVGMASTANILALLPNLILHFFFAIALALIRVFTGSLWASVGFHLGYLAVARFILMPEAYGATPIVTFRDNMMQGVGAVYAIMFIILGTIILLLILLGIKRRKNNLLKAD